MIRYREFTYTTARSIKRFNKHIGRLGKVAYIRGYRYRNLLGIIREAVLIRGENGTIRLSGMCWGYTGEGPHGLRDVLTSLGVPTVQAEQVAFHSPRPWPTVQEDWRVTL